TLASVLLIRRALGGRYNNVGIRAASSPGPPLSRTASGPDIPSGSCRSAARQMDGRAAYKERSLFLGSPVPADWLAIGGSDTTDHDPSSDTSAGCSLESRDRTSGTEPHRLLFPGGPQTQ